MIEVHCKAFLMIWKPRCAGQGFVLSAVICRSLGGPLLAQPFHILRVDEHAENGVLGAELPGCCQFLDRLRGRSQPVCRLRRADTPVDGDHSHGVLLT
jgi:hypothetical protein